VIRAAHSGAQHPPQKFPIVVIGGAGMAQTILIQPAVGHGIVERQASVVDRPGAARRRRLSELAAAVATRKSEPRAISARSCTIERFDSELVTFPRRFLCDSGLFFDWIAQLVNVGAVRRAECFAPFATAPPSDPRSIWIF